MSDPLESTHLKLPYLAAAQAQKHVTHNEALRLLDTVVQLSVIDASLTDPPASPAEGDRYIVAATATGDWAGEEGNVATFVDGGWQFLVADTGWFAFDAAAAVLMVRQSGGWEPAAGYLNPIDQLGVNATADDTNRLAVRSDAVLFSNIEAASGGSGDVRFVVNKETAADTASLLFQTGYSGRAEVGLVGDDDFVFKVSPDGSAWNEAIRIDKTSGLPTIGYDNAGSGLAATTVQAAIDEIVGASGAVSSVFGRTGAVTAAAGDYAASEVDYDNASSGLSASDVQAAIDEIVGVSGAVSSVFGRTGAVTAAAGDYAASEVDNDSGVGGTHVSDALDALDGAISGKQDADGELAAIAGLTSAADKLPYFTGSGTAALADFTAAGRALVDDADAAAMRTTLGLAIGTDVEAHDGDLTTIAGLTPSDDDVLQRKSGAWTNRTPAELKADLSLSASDVGLGSVSDDAQLKIASNLSDLASAATARTNLGLGGAAVEDLMASGDLYGKTADAVLTADGVFSDADLVSLTDAATIAVDLSTFINATVTLAGNRTLGNPSNTTVGQSGVIYFVQDGTGSRTLALASNWKTADGGGITLSTTAGAVDRAVYFVRSSTHIDIDLTTDRS